jgi:hypothetical protein
MKVKINNLLFYNLYKYIINNILLLYNIIDIFIFYYKLI